MSAFLPHADPDPAGRADALAAARTRYRYNFTHVSPLAVVDRVPIEDEFSFRWLLTVADRVMVTLANRAEREIGSAAGDYHRTKGGLLAQLVAAGEAAVGDVRTMVVDALRFDGRIGSAPVRATSLEDYAGLFRSIGLPPVARDYADDATFAWMRVAGPNPVMLQRLSVRDERLPLSDAEFAAVIPGDSFDAALAGGRLYLADYSRLSDAPVSDYPDGRKYLYAPLALFVADRLTKALRPVAIQCEPRPGPANPVLTPLDGTNWLLAKTVVEVADGNVHEAMTHLGRTHLLMEPFAVSTFRQLAPNHPLGVLLAPHFEGTLAINEASWRHLVANKGAVDKLLGSTIDFSRGLAATGVQTARVTELRLPDTFAARGVADAASLPDYPYRDDSLLYWGAIRDWVSAYLALYYPSDADVAADAELQAWARELAAPDGGRIAGVPNGGAFLTVAELVDVATLVLFTCSAQHAAVNFPQYDLMSYVPNMPLAGYAPAPTAKSGATRADYLAMLPPLDVAELQMELGYLLGTVHYTTLGDYRGFADPRVAAPLAAFQRRLAEVGDTVAARNRERRAYTFLTPSGVPQSINI